MYVYLYNNDAYQSSLVVIAVFAEVLGQNFLLVLHPRSLVDKLKSLASNRLVHCQEVLTRISQKSVS